MNGKKEIGLAVAGVGSMGNYHLENIADIGNVRLKAVFDCKQALAEERAEKWGVKAFHSYERLLDWGGFDGVLIATPHYFHKELAVKAFERGFHVLTEKPVGVHANDVLAMTAAWNRARVKNKELVFSAMFQQRTLGQWGKIKELIDSGELGKLVRATWIITDWFRPQYYYDHGDWRATWKGEGGGVLLNQCPHQLDIFQWLFGMPDRVMGFASLGKYHQIEVEDEVTGYFHYDNGFIGHFITSTGEAPGTNRLEIVGEMGKLVFENDRLSFVRNRSSMLEFIKTARSSFGTVESWNIEVPYVKSEESGHRKIIENFADAILNGIEPVAPAEEGLNSVSLGNAIMLSHFEGRMVDLPLDGDAYEKKLRELVEKSGFDKKSTQADGIGDMSSSF